MPATGRIVFLGIFLAALVSPLAAQANRPIYLYATNYSSGGPGTVSAFKVDLATGVLSPVRGSPFPAGSGPSGVVVDPTGRLVYVTNSGSNDIWGYSVDAATGVLTPLPGSPYPDDRSPAAIAVDPTGRFLYVSDTLPDQIGNHLLRAFSIDSLTGVLTSLPGSPYSELDFLGDHVRSFWHVCLFGRIAQSHWY
jgi:6-phosphogluconolactonase